jgi:hypothetical protein
VTDVISFRPTPEERAAIDQARLAHGLDTRAEAVRFLLRRGAEREGPLAADPVFRFRLGGKRARRSLSSRELDDALYGRPDR